MKRLGTRRLVAILTVPRLMLGRPLGGAEAIADQLVRRLSAWFDIFVLHGYEARDVPTRGQRQIAPRISACDAFPVTDAVRYGGVIAGELLSPEAREVLAKCEALISFERVLELRTQCIRYAVLGGTGYPHCGELARSGHWDYLIVPSVFVRDIVAANWLNGTSRVLVIPNGINVNIFCPAGRRTLGCEGQAVLLIPSRPDRGKGFQQSLEFAKACEESGFQVAVHCLRQRSFTCSELFYDDLCRYADRLNVGLEIRPWVARSEMPSVYRGASLTLCLGDLPEGFCLVAAESIACGTPVLARPVGFLRDMFPANHGLRSITSDSDLAEATRGLLGWVEEAGLECLERGFPFVSQKYSEDIMIESYLSLLTNFNKVKR